MKIINIELNSLGNAIIKDYGATKIYVEENLSTTFRFYFFNKQFLDNDKYLKTITIRNKKGCNSYNLNSNEYMLKKEDLSINGEIIITIEIAKIEQFGNPQFLIKYVLPPLIVCKADGVVATLDWKKEYEDLFEQSLGTQLEDFKQEIIDLRKDVNDYDDDILLLQQKNIDQDDRLGVVENNINAINDEFTDEIVRINSELNNINNEVIRIDNKVDNEVIRIDNKIISTNDRIDKNIIDIDDRTENAEWIIEDELPTDVRFPITRNGWCQVNDEVYIFGGSNINSTTVANTLYADVSYKYNLKTKVWTRLADRDWYYNEDRCVYYDGNIYIFGGSHPTGKGNTNPYLQHMNMKYNIATNTFSYLSDAPYRWISLSGAVLVGTKVYVFMDYYLVIENGNPIEYTSNTTPIVYDILTDTWEVKTASNIRFDRGNAVLYNNLIYIQRSLKFQSYDYTNDIWTTLTSPIYGVVHTGLLQIYKDRLFVGGGYETNASINRGEIQYYNFSENKWYIATRIIFKGYDLGYGSLVLLDNKLYYLGGVSNYADDVLDENPNYYVYSFNLEQLKLDEYNSLDNKIDILKQKDLILDGEIIDLKDKDTQIEDDISNINETLNQRISIIRLWS